MKKKSSIIIMSLLSVVLILGLILSFCSFKIGLTDYKSFFSSIKLGLDLKGGVYAVYTADETDTDDIDSRMEGTRAGIVTLLTEKGYTEATVTREGTFRLRVEVPDEDDPSSILDILGEPAELRFELVGGGEGGNEIILTGDNVVDAVAGYYEGSPIVSLKFDSAGAKAFGEATSNNIGGTIETILTIGGEDQTVNSATIQSAITDGNAMITGIGDYESAEKLANQIMSGTFSVTLSLIDSSTISATLGDKALAYGVIAGGVGILLVMAFMIATYGLFGVMSSFALMLYVVMTLFILAVFPWVQLTLPGIAGILLSIGMAIDGNVIICERIKDEYRSGKSILSAVHYGYKKAFWAIFDGNLTTVIAAVVLCILGTGSVKGFGMTLLIGIVLSIFSSLFITKLLFNCIVALNNHNNKMYRLKRGADFEGLGANENSAAVQLQIDEEMRAKEEEKRKRQLKNNLRDGGTV